MPTSVQANQISHGSTKRKHIEIESANDNTATTAATEPGICAENEANALRKGRRACNECRQQKVRSIFDIKSMLLAGKVI